MSIQKKKNEEFELKTFILLDVIHSHLSYFYGLARLILLQGHDRLTEKRPDGLGAQNQSICTVCHIKLRLA